jgi:hypothetical protein
MRVYYPPQKTEQIHELAQYAFEALYVAWSYVGYIKDQSNEDVRSFLWNSPMVLPDRWDEDTPHTPPPMSSLWEVFGAYTPAKLKQAYTALGQVGDYFISSEPLRIFYRDEECSNPVITKPTTHNVYLCKSLWKYDTPHAADRLLRAIAELAGLDSTLARKLANYIVVRYQYASTCLVPEAARPACTAPYAANIWFTPSDSGKDDCTDSETDTLIQAYERAYGWVANAKWFLDQLAQLPEHDRERMWNWGYLAPGSIQATTAHQDGGDTYSFFWSPSNWFGLYASNRFYAVQNIVGLLWQRFQTGTDKNSPVKLMCRSHKDCWSLGTHTASGWHSPTNVGKIYLCKAFFSAQPGEQAEIVLHEMMHFLVGDSALTNDPRDVVSKSACGSDWRNACYGDARSRNLLSKWGSETVHNVENYVSWIFWFNWFGSNRGCWPAKWIDHGIGADQPGAWIGPP